MPLPPIPKSKSVAWSVVQTATFQLIVACTVMFILIKLTGNRKYMGVSWYFFLEFLTTHPSWFFGASWITSGFVHKEFAHLFGNMFFLYLCAVPLELRFGPRFVWTLFFLGDIAGNIAILETTKIPTVSFGASSGVAAILVSFFLFFPRFTFFPNPGDVQGIYERKEGVSSIWLLGFFLANNFFGFFLDKEAGIGWAGHLGGAAIGFISWTLADSSSKWGEWKPWFKIPNLLMDFWNEFTFYRMRFVLMGMVALIVICGFLVSLGFIHPKILFPGLLN